MRSYELMYILDPKLDEDGATALLGKLQELMSKQGVEVGKTEPWGKRRLAYAINGHWEGNYILSYLKAEPEAVSEMERRLRVTDGVLRFLTVRMDEQQDKQERRKSRADVKSKARRGRKAAAASSAAERTPAAPTKTPAPAPTAAAPTEAPAPAPAAAAPTETPTPAPTETPTPAPTEPAE